MKKVTALLLVYVGIEVYGHVEFLYYCKMRQSYSHLTAKVKNLEENRIETGHIVISLVFLVAVFAMDIYQIYVRPWHRWLVLPSWDGASGQKSILKFCFDLLVTDNSCKILFSENKLHQSPLYIHVSGLVWDGLILHDLFWHFDISFYYF